MKQLLDHGYVKFIESWGHGEPMPEGWQTREGQVIKHVDEREAGIIEAARQSTQGSFRGWETDEKLLGFLFNNKPPHSTPFEFAGMIIEVQAPILVFREWQRHRTQFYNEMSARYAPLPDLNYVPSIERLMVGASLTNKQAGTIKDAAQMTTATAHGFREGLAYSYEQSEKLYQWALTSGVPKELARVHLPVGRYSRMRAGTSLRNWLAFLTLRSDPGAQWEIRQYADAVGEIVAQQFPKTWAHFAAGRA